MSSVASRRKRPRATPGSSRPRQASTAPRPRTRRVRDRARSQTRLSLTRGRWTSYGGGLQRQQDRAQRPTDPFAKAPAKRPRPASGAAQESNLPPAGLRRATGFEEGSFLAAIARLGLR